MPAPARPAPIKIAPESTRFTNGIVGHYSDAEIDALLAALPAGGSDSAVTVHDGSIPNPASETPKGLEDSLAAYADGLHFFKATGSLLAITRQALQTDITLTGPVSSVAKIVKSEAGLPTPQNPSLIVMKSVDGQWIKMTSDALDEPFGQPQMADPFDIPKALFDKDLRLGNVSLKGATFQDAYTFYVDNVGAGVRPVIEYSDRGQVTTVTIPAQDDVDRKADLTNEGQNITAGRLLLSEIGFVRYGSVGNLYLQKAGDQYQLVSFHEDGPTRVEHIYATKEDIKPLQQSAATAASQELLDKSVKDLVWFIEQKADKTSVYTKPEVDAAIANAATGGTVDLSAYAKKEDNQQQLLAKTITATALGFGDRVLPPVAVTWTDTGEGYGERLVLTRGLVNDYFAMQSDFEPVISRLDALENKSTPTPVSADAAGYAKLTDANQTIVSNVVQATRYRFDDTRSLILLLSNGSERPVFRDGGKSNGLAFVSELAACVQRDELAPYATSQYVDDRIAAINPTSAANINDPALDEFKKSILEEVAKKMAGDSRYTPPEDILKTGTTRSGFFVQMVNGWIELIGTVPIPKGSSSMTLGTLPDKFPLPDREASYPVACREAGVAVRYGYISVNTANRTISFSPGGVVDEVTVSGVRFKAKWS